MSRYTREPIQGVGTSSQYKTKYQCRMGKILYRLRSVVPVLLYSIKLTYMLSGHLRMKEIPYLLAKCLKVTLLDLIKLGP